MTHPAGQLAIAVADELADPNHMIRDLPEQPWLRQSLWHGMPGVIMLHTELAAAEQRPWHRVRTWVDAACGNQITTGPHTNLTHGAPAIGHALAGVAEVKPGAYERALLTIDTAVSADARRRVDAAHARMDAGQPATLAEFDVIRGLAGIGTYLLRREPDGTAVRAVLEYLVRLTDTVTTTRCTVVPGWWTPTGPSGRADNRYPEGHLNSGVAHGIAGPLALLAYAARVGVLVDGQRAAITAITNWLNSWRTTTAAGVPVWPYWITPAEVGTPARSRPEQRPSWCYGSAGVVSALHAAALVVADPEAAADAATVLLQALTDADHLNATGDDTSLCHGYAGLALVALRIGTATASEPGPQLLAVADALLDRIANTMPALPTQRRHCCAARRVQGCSKEPQEPPCAVGPPPPARRPVGTAAS
ncbi:lanthionine synthetase C family protein [Luedemannella flava]